MNKILIFGNSGSGKSTLAKELCRSGAAHLDLDTLAWKPGFPPERMPLDISARQIEEFMDAHDEWVIEGCYTDLLEFAEGQATEIIFMNIPVEVCIANARNRPWEPHKYPSKEAQDANLAMLVDWISQYAERNDTFSLASHQRFFDGFAGKKTVHVSNDFTNMAGRT